MATGRRRRGVRVSAPQAFCLCVKEGDEWVRVVTVWGTDQLEAYERAACALRASQRDLPRMFRGDQLCPPCDGGVEAG